MQQRNLGTQGLAVSAIGLGCMGMSEFYGATDEAEAIATIHRALDLGVTLLDTADIYGYGENERLVGRALHGRRDGAVVASKFGIMRKRDDPGAGSCRAGSAPSTTSRPTTSGAACRASRARTSRATSHSPTG